MWYLVLSTECLLMIVADRYALAHCCCVLAGSRVLINMAVFIISITTHELHHGSGLCLCQQGIWLSLVYYI